MVFKLLFLLLKAGVSVITAMLPTWTPLDLASATDAINAQGGLLFGMVAWADQYFPARMLMAFLLAYFGMYTVAATVKAITWLLTKLHIAGGS